MKDKLIINGLRLARIGVGIYMGNALLGLLGGLAILFKVHQSVDYLLIFLVLAANFGLALFVFEWMRMFIHRVHKARFGKPHPALMKILSV